MPDNKHKDILNSLPTNAPKEGYFGNLPSSSGYSEFGKAYGNVGYGQSKYDDYLTPHDVETKSDADLQAYLNDQRAAAQDNWDKWGNAVPNFGATAIGTIVGGTAGLINEVYDKEIKTRLAAAQDGEYQIALGNDVVSNKVRDELYGEHKPYGDNAVTRTMQEFMESTREEHPFYYSGKARDYGLLKESTTANFWADKFMNGLATTVGSYGVGMLTGNPLIGATMGAYGESAMESIETADNIRHQLNTTLEGLAVKQANGSLSTKEKRQLDILSKPDYIDRAVEAGANDVFAVNMAIGTLTNAISLNNLIGTSYKGALKEFVDVGDLTKVAKLKDISRLKYAGKEYLSNAIPEGTQEGFQFALQKYAEDYYVRRFDDDSRSVISSFTEGMKETFGSKDGLESILLGFLTGGVTSSIKGAVDYSKLKEHAGLVVDALNNTDGYKHLNDLVDNFNTTNSYNKDLDNNITDKKTYKDVEFEKAQSQIKMLLDLGSTDAVKSKLKQSVNLTPEEFEKSTGFKAEDQSQIKQRVKDTLSMIDKMEDHYNYVNNRFVNPFDPKKESANYKAHELLKTTLWKQLTTFDNADNRLDSIYKDVFNTIQLHDSITGETAPLLMVMSEAMNISKSSDTKGLNEKINAALKAYSESNPMITERIIDDVNDFFKLVGRKKSLLDSYNSFENKDTYDNIITELSEIINKQEVKNKQNAERTERPLQAKDNEDKLKQERAIKLIDDAETQEQFNAAVKYAKDNKVYKGNVFDNAVAKNKVLEGKAKQAAREAQEAQGTQNTSDDFTVTEEAPNAVKAGFGEVLDDIPTGEEPVTKSIGQRIDALVRLMTGPLKMNPATFKFEDLYKAFKENFEEDYIRGKFELLKSVAAALQASSNNPNVKSTYLYDIDDNLNLIKGGKETVLEEEVIENTHNNKEKAKQSSIGVMQTIASDKFKEPEYKIVSPMSMAFNQVDYVAQKTGELNPDGSENYMYANNRTPIGDLIFNTNQSQVVATSKVVVGDTIILVTEPGNNPVEAPVAIYKEFNGTRVKLGYLHKDDYINEANMALNPIYGSVESRRAQLVDLRVSLYNYPIGTEFEAKVTDRGFGYLNFSEHQRPINEIWSENMGVAIMQNSTIITSNTKLPLYSADYKIDNGSVMITVPHANGYTIPVVVTQQPIETNPTVHNKLHQVLVDYLEGKYENKLDKFNSIIERYLYQNPNKVYTTKNKEGNRIVSINNVIYTLDNYKEVNKNSGQDMMDALGKQRFNLNNKLLKGTSTERDTYVKEVLDSKYLVTNLQANVVTLPDGTKESTYFHQVTTVVGDVKLVNTQAEVTESEPIVDIEAKKADIERRRQEELNSESYRIPVSKETRTWTDEDGTKFETTITTFKDGSKQATNKNLETQGITPISKYNKDLSNEKIYEIEAPSAIEKGEVQQQEVKSVKISDKINAKYNAELAALESPEQSNEEFTKAEQALKDSGLTFDDVPVATKQFTSNTTASKVFTAGMQHDITMSIAHEMINAESDDVDFKPELQVFDKISDNRNKVKAVVDAAIKANKPQEIIDKYQQGLDYYNEVLKEEVWEQVISDAKKFIESLGIKETEDGFYESVEETDEDINQMVDNAVAYENRKDGATAKLKKFLYFIPYIETNADGTTKTKNNVIGLSTFADYTSTFQHISLILSKTRFKSTMGDVERMITILSSHESPMVREVANRLSTTKDDGLKRSFFTVFNQQHAIWKALKFSFRKGKKLMASLINADRNMAQEVVVKNWYESFKTSNSGIIKWLIDPTKGGQATLTIDTIKGKMLYDKAEALLGDDKNFTKAEGKHYMLGKAVSELHAILNDAGINISKAALNTFLHSQKAADGRQLPRVVAKEYILNTILKRVAGLAKKGFTDTSNEDIVSNEANNPFIKETSSLQALAKYEYANRNNIYSPSFRHAGKQFYSLIRHNPLSEMFLDLMGDNKVESASYMLENNFSSESLWLNEIANGNNINLEMYYEKGMRNDGTKKDSKDLRDALPKEHELHKILAFQNQGADKVVFHSDTHSDKSMKVMIGVNKHKLGSIEGNIKDGNIKLPKATLDLLARYFFAEHKRIIAVQKFDNRIKELTSKEDKTEQEIKELDTLKRKALDKYHSSKGEKGMGSYFNIYSFLNEDQLTDNPLLTALYDENGDLIEKLSPEAISAVKTLINENFNGLFKAKLDSWTELGILSHEGDLRSSFDRKYVDKLAKELGIDINNLFNKSKAVEDVARRNTVLDNLIVDYVINYAIQTNEMLMLTGDPALQGKWGKKDKTSVDKVRATFNNVGKRNARLLASGNKGAFDKPTYNTYILQDLDIESPLIKEYVKLLKGSVDTKEIEVKYGTSAETDAQELTTVEEHLDVMKAYDEINDKQYKDLLGIFDPEAYNKKFGEPTPEFTNDELSKALKVVLQPMKPVQVSSNTENGLRTDYYIKTSSFPLIPSVIAGNPMMENLLAKMKKHEIQRVAFKSGAKIGVSNLQSLLDKDNNPNEALFEDKMPIVLNRDGFYIQLKVPYKADKNAVREGTQFMKLLFADLEDNIKIGDSTVKELRDEYTKLHRQLVDQLRKELYDELGVVNGQITKLDTLAKILQDEAKDRGYSLNSIYGLEVKDNKFKTPLTFLPNSGQIEPVLTSIITNRLTKLKIPGRSYVQGSEVIFRKRNVTTLEDTKNKSTIVFTSDENRKLSKLKYASKEGKAQVILPMNFNHEGKVIDFKKYITKDGLLDITKIDPKLLEIIGFRIPTQGHNSMITFEVVGFLPAGAGDLIIVPAEIAAQMGSDFDVDKLYVYNRAYSVNEDGSITVNNEGNNGITNRMFDISDAILSNEQVLKYMITPISSDNLADTIKKLSKDLGNDRAWLGNYDTDYQRREYFDNVGGKSGVGIGANANTQHIMFQQANVFIKGTGIIFLDEEDNVIDDNFKSNRINEFNKDIYTYQVRKGEETITLDQTTEKGVSRLDKIKAFSGRRISEIISEWLGAAVDNAKDKLLGSGGINNSNFNVALLLARTGFDNNWIIPFINQPAIVEYNTAIESIDDITNTEFDPTVRAKTLNDVITKYAKLMKPELKGAALTEHIKQVMEDFTKPIEGVKLSQLESNLSNPDPIIQLEILKQFLHYNGIATEMVNVTSALNSDSKGVGKSILDMTYKANKIARLSPKNLGNIDNVSQNTILSPFVNAPIIGTNLFGNLFQYGTQSYTGLLTKLKSLTGIDFSEKLDKVEGIYNKIAEYAYTHPKFNFGNIKELRSRLTIDTETNKSLAVRLMELQSLHPNNFMLQRMSTNITEVAGEPKLVNISNTTYEGTDFENRVSQEWLSMLASENPQLKGFAEDLVKYAFVVNANKFGTSNFMRYVPGEYLDYMGFSDVLNSLDFNDETLFAPLGLQLLQHDPSLASWINMDDASLEGGVFRTEDGEYTYAFKPNDHNNLMMETELPDGTIGRGYKPYIRAYSGEKLGAIVYAYMQDPSGEYFYIALPKLGKNNFTEFDYGKTSIQNSLITSNNNPTQSFSKVITKPTEAKEDTLEDIYFKSNNPKDLLRTIISREPLITHPLTEGYIALAEVLSQYDTDYTIVYDKSPKAFATTDFTNKKIILNPERLSNKSQDEIHRIILHEILHSLTAQYIKDNTIDRELDLNNPIIRDLTNVWNGYKGLVDNMDKTPVFGINKSKFQATVFSKISEIYKNRNKFNDVTITDLEQAYNHLFTNETLLNELASQLGITTDKVLKAKEKGDINLTDLTDKKSIYYPYINLYEFVTESMTSKDLQDLLKGGEGKGIKVKNSLWDKFIKAIARIFGKPTLLEDTIASIVNVIDDSSSPFKEELHPVKPQVSGPISENTVDDVYYDDLGLNTNFTQDDFKC